MSGVGPTSRRPVEFGTDPLSQLSGSSSDSEAPDIQSSESRNSLVARSRSDPTGWDSARHLSGAAKVLTDTDSANALESFREMNSPNL